MKKIFLVLSLVVYSLCTAAAPNVPQLQIALKPREPNWRGQIVKSYPSGTPQIVLFFQPLIDGTEAPVKQIMFYENSSIQTEMDVAMVDAESAAAKEWKANVVPHGARVDFNNEGILIRAGTFDRGYLHGESRQFYADFGEVWQEHRSAFGKHHFDC